MSDVHIIARRISDGSKVHVDFEDLGASIHMFDSGKPAFSTKFWIGETEWTSQVEVPRAGKAIMEDQYQVDMNSLAEHDVDPGTVEIVS